MGFAYFAGVAKYSIVLLKCPAHVIHAFLFCVTHVCTETVELQAKRRPIILTRVDKGFRRRHKLGTPPRSSERSLSKLEPEIARFLAPTSSIDGLMPSGVFLVRDGVSNLVTLSRRSHDICHDWGR